jgi:hypothetical protein
VLTLWLNQASGKPHLPYKKLDEWMDEWMAVAPLDAEGSGAKVSAFAIRNSERL